MSKTADKKTQETKKGMKPLRLLLVNLVAMAAVVVVAVFITFRWMDSYTEHGKAIVVPDIQGMEEADAMSKLAQHDLVGVVSDHVYIKGVPPGEITAQRPAAHAKVKRGRKVYLTVSSGNQPMIAIPDIADNSSLRQAESRLRAAGFKLAPNDTIAGDLDWVYGVRYKERELKAGELVPEGAELTLVVGGGNKEETETLGAPVVEDGWF
jgi:beta-lactam-binding protein with PASTA domain